MFCAVLGIGRAAALALARGGAEVIAVTRTQADLDSLVSEVLTMLLRDYRSLIGAIMSLYSSLNLRLLFPTGAIPLCF